MIAVMLVIAGYALTTMLKPEPVVLLPKVNDTKKTLAELEDALELYKELNGSYPCPASRSLAPSHADFGVASTCKDGSNECQTSAGVACGSTTVAIGTVPTRALQLPDQLMFDEWGNRIGYAMGVAGQRDVEIQTIAGGSRTSRYFLFSHGPNGRGAYNRSGNVTQPCGNADNPPYDPENCDDSDAIFVESAWKQAASSTVRDYDDLTTAPLADPPPCPASVDNCFLWLAANDIDGNNACREDSEEGCELDEGEPSDGDSVDTWVDRSQNGNDFVAGSAPVLDVDGANGIPSVHFDGTDYLEKETNWGTAYTLTFVVKKDGANAWDYWLGIGPSTKHLYYIRDLNGDGFYIYSRGATFYPGARLMSIYNKYMILTLRREVGTGSFEVFMNGIQIASETAAAGLFDEDMNFTLGASNTTLTSGLVGDYSEVIYYKSALESSSREDIECYLAEKYGITVSHCSDPCSSLVLTEACPAGVAGCSMWFRADDTDYLRHSDGLPVAADGDSVTTWCDVSGVDDGDGNITPNGNDAQVWGEATYNANGMGTGLPSVSVSDESNNVLGQIHSPLIDYCDGYTVLAAFKLSEIKSNIYAAPFRTSYDGPRVSFDQATWRYIRSHSATAGAIGFMSPLFAGMIDMNYGSSGKKLGMESWE